jgi:hypothetical protein
MILHQYKQNSVSTNKLSVVTHIYHLISMGNGNRMIVVQVSQDKNRRPYCKENLEQKGMQVRPEW